MTAADVIAQLQAAWNAAPTLPAQPATVPLIVLPPFQPPVNDTPKGLASCSAHTNRADWLDEPDESRRGWIRTTCRICGGFIGYRTHVVRKSKKS